MSNKIYFTPGPAQLFYTFNDHLKRALAEDIPSISHRSTKFVSILEHTTSCLKELLQIPDGYDVFFINSANEAWDRIIQNLVKEKSHHFANGAFSKKFYDFAIQHGIQAALTEAPDGDGFTDFSVGEGTELIGLTKNETSTGFTITDEEIKLVRNKCPEALIALDVVSAVPSTPVDFSHVDTAYFSVQKGFGLPAGLGVWVCNQRCQERAVENSKNGSIGSYRTLMNLKAFSDKGQTPETPNMLYIYLLGKIAEDMLSVGVQKVRNDTIYKSTILYQAIKDHSRLEPFVKSEEHRSKTTIVADIKEPSEFLASFEKMGLILGSGYGKHKNNHIRFANFPTHSKELVEMLCDRIVAYK